MNASDEYDPCTVDHGITDDLTFEYISNGILLTLVGVFGILGNCISIIILSRPQMRSSINCCLIGLSSFDLVLLVTSILMFGLPSVARFTRQISMYLYIIFPFITPFVYALGMTAQTGSVYMTLTVTLERYVAVCHPLKARSWCTFGRARGYILAVVFIAIVYNITRFLEVKIQECTDAANATFFVVMPSALRQSIDYMNWYYTWAYLFVMYFIPFLTLAIFNGLIYQQVRRANKERTRLTRLQMKEIRLAVMLLFVVMVFFICNILAFIVNVLEVIGYQQQFDKLVKLSNLLVTINSSCNFIIYCIFGQKFKSLFFRLFCCRSELEHRFSVYDDNISQHSFREHQRLMNCNGSLASRSQRVRFASTKNTSTRTTTSVYFPNKNMATASKKTLKSESYC